MSAGITFAELVRAIAPTVPAGDPAVQWCIESLELTARFNGAVRRGAWAEALELLDAMERHDETAPVGERVDASEVYDNMRASLRARLGSVQP